MANVGGKRNNYRVREENVKGRDNLEDISRDGRIILKWIPKICGRVNTKFI